MKTPKPSEDYSCTADNVYRQREILSAALRAIAGMKCDGDLWHGNEDGENVTNDEEHDAFVEALCIAREAIAQMEGAQ
jgi:hypothetical protein